MATRSGYKKYEIKNIRVGTQEFITLDVRLEIGQTTESVTISGEAVVLESSNPSIATTLETRALQELPTPARSVFFLSVATPSVVPTGDPQFVRQQDQTNSSLLSLGGGPRRANNYTIDGVSITDCATARSSSRTSNRCRKYGCRSAPTTLRWGAPAAASSTPRPNRAAMTGTAACGLQNRPSFASSQLFFARKADAEA